MATLTNADIQSEAAILRQAFASWQAANPGRSAGEYTKADQKRFLPQGYKYLADVRGYERVGGWQRAKELGLDAYDQFGNIISRSSMVPSGMGDAIARGQYVPPNIMADAMGMPRSEINRLSTLGTTTTTPTPPPALTIPATTVPGTTTGLGSPANIAEAAKNLASAPKPTVPQFVQPYGRPRGFGSYGEKDINW